MSDRNSLEYVIRPRIRIRFLGVFSLADRSGTVLRFPTRHASVLVAFLAYHADRNHSRDKLAEMLWPNADFDEQRNRFRVALSQARKLLEPSELDSGSVLEVTRQTVKFNRDAATIDIDSLDHALRNLDHAQIAVGKDAEFCEGWYDDWVVETRTYWQNRIDAATGHDVIITDDLRQITDERPVAAQLCPIPRESGKENLVIRLDLQ
jgi:DNA-binding SARP family transcriptional activator